MESDVVELRAKLDQMATKADLAAAVSTMIKWMVGTMATTVAVTITVMTFVLNYAAPPRPSALAPAPVAPVAMPVPVQPPVIIVLPWQGGAVQWPPQPATK